MDSKNSEGFLMMAPSQQLSRPYSISVTDPDGGGRLLAFTATFRRNGEAAPVQCIAQVDLTDCRIDWSNTRDDPGDAKGEIESEIRRRLQLRQAWIDRVEELVSMVESWVRKADWSTKRIPFRLDDREIGKHPQTALMMQSELCKVLLEPVARSTPGADGLVDLYLLPAYDDIASLYYSDSKWRLHYMFPGSPVVGNIREAEGRELREENLLSVLSEMQSNAE